MIILKPIEHIVVIIYATNLCISTSSFVEDDLDPHMSEYNIWLVWKPMNVYLMTPPMDKACSGDIKVVFHFPFDLTVGNCLL